MRVQKTPQEIEKEMEKYPVVTFADILRALKAHPDWLEEIRKLILTSELLELPKKVDELLRRVEAIEKDVEVLKQDVKVLKQDVAILKQDVAILKQDVAILKQDMKYLKGEVGRLKGGDFERKVRDKYYAYFGRLLKKAKLIPFEEILSLIDDAEDEGLISERERNSLLDLDLVVKGLIRSTRKPVVLAVEISYTLFEKDMIRSIERANTLAKVLKEEVIPCLVFVEAKENLEEIAKEKGVLTIKINY